MKLSDIFKKSKKGVPTAAIQKIDKKKLMKIIGGTDELSNPIDMDSSEAAKITPKISKESHGKF